MASCVPWQPDMACASDWESLDPDLQERATDLAWASMRYLTAGLVGTCEATMRPCAAAPCDACVSTWMQPYIQDGAWHNAKPCGGAGCSCVQLSEVVLPGQVASVTGVVLDGALLDPSTYRLDHPNRLVRIDGGVFPSCQDMRLPDDAIGALAVYYVPGVKPGGAGLWAVGVLAYEFSKACMGGKCRLPASVTSIARQGVSMEFNNVMFADGMTGIREVDAYLLSVNPHAMKVPPRVWSPDIVHGRFVPPAAQAAP
jgi:hypothetical protein